MTRGYRGDKELRRVTGDDKALQGVKRSYKGL